MAADAVNTHMKQRFHLLVIFALWGLGMVITSQPARGEVIAASEELQEYAEHTSETPTQNNSLTEKATDLNDGNGLIHSPEGNGSSLIAAPQNLDPGLYEPPPISPVQNETPANDFNQPLESGNPSVDPLVDPLVESNNLDALDGTIPEEHIPFITWEGLDIDFSDTISNFGQGNRIVTPILRGHLANGDPVSFSPGFNQFALPGLETVTHVPLTVNWEGDINDVTLAAGGGLDIYNRLPLDTHFNAQASVPIGDANLSLSVDQGPYLFNAQTLENGISSWRYGPDLFWQIDPQTTLFSLLRIGHFNDGNFEQQSFSRLERRFWGDAAIAANLFNWSFQQDLEATSGYFSPPDFLVASLEVSWEKEIIENISCRVAASVGQQRLNGAWAAGYGHQAICDLDIIPGVAFDFGYNFNNVGNGQSFLAEESAFNNFEWVGGVKTQF